MSSLVIALTFSYPEKAYSSFCACGAHRPAEIRLEFEDGVPCIRQVPVCVARACQKNRPALPQDRDAVLIALERIDRSCCMQQLVKILSRRDHGTAESREKLIAQGFAIASADCAIARARALRMIDDERSARAYAEGLTRRGWGRAMVRLKLGNRGFSEDEIARATEGLCSFDSELKRALGLLERHSVPAASPFEKLARYLAAKGYAAEIVCRAVREHLGELDA